MEVTLALGPGRICKYCEEYSRQRKTAGANSLSWGYFGVFNEKAANVTGALLMRRRREIRRGER